MKLNNILLPFDGSEYSVNATKYALDLAKIADASVNIVYCDDWNIQYSEVPDALVEEIRINRKKDAQVLLKRADGIF
jgi:nucleotide-binding universal stress UspA family protein